MFGILDMHTICYLIPLTNSSVTRKGKIKDSVTISDIALQDLHTCAAVRKKRYRVGGNQSAIFPSLISSRKSRFSNAQEQLGHADMNTVFILAASELLHNYQ